MKIGTKKARSIIDLDIAVRALENKIKEQHDEIEKLKNHGHFVDDSATSKPKFIIHGE